MPITALSIVTILTEDFHRNVMGTHRSPPPKFHNEISCSTSHCKVTENEKNSLEILQLGIICVS